MSDYKMPEKHADPFSRYMQDRLKGHSVRPDDACWDEIEARMRPVRKFPLRRIGVAAAAVVLAVFLLQLFRVEEQETRPQLHSEQQLPGLPEKEAAPGEQLAQVLPEISTVQDVMIEKRVAERAEERVIEEATEDAEEEGTEPETVSSPPEKKEEAKPVYHPAVQGRSSPFIQQKKNNSWLVAAAFGTGSGINFSFLDASKNSPDNDFGSSPDPGQKPDPPWTGNEFTDYHNLEEYSDARYGLPFSVGITVRKNIHKYIAVESGLVYTYLSSKFRENRFEARYGAKSELHYLGIPLNVVGNLYRNPSWNVYVSGGVMAEKGLRSVTSFHKTTREGAESSTERSSIKGVQWSVNGAVGVSYRLFNEWSIYVEPRLSYYFDSGQPASIRTDKPVTFGIGGGIRYAF